MQFEPESTALVLIEYQNEWVSAQGSLRQKLVVEEKQFEHAIESSPCTRHLLLTM